MIEIKKNFSTAAVIAIFLNVIILLLTSCGSATIDNTASGSQTPDTTENPVQINETDDEIIMSNNRLFVVISKPGKGYKGTRFDWAGIVKQVTLDNMHTFLSTEKSNYVYDQNLGYGLIGQFEPALARMGEGEYTVSVDNSSVAFIKDLQKDDKGRGYKFSKILTLDQNKLNIKCTLENTGEKSLTFGEYNHNFMIINKEPVSGDYELKFSFTPQIKSTTTGKNLFSLEKDTLTWTKQLTDKDEFLCQMSGYEKGKKDYYWQLTHKPSGVGVKSVTDFEIVKIQLWGKGHTICPEVFFQQKVNPGEIFEWNRTYEFFVS